MRISDHREWYVTKLPGLGWAIRSGTFIGEHDEDDLVIGFIQSKDNADEIVEAHNTSDAVVKNKAHVLKRLGE